MTGDQALKTILLASPRGFCAGVVRARAYLVDDVSQIQPQWLDGVATVGLTSGASAPEFLVQEILGYLQALGGTRVREALTVREEVFFPLPPEVARVRETARSALAHS
jgi:4-hydroxy-3-methylbut-2-enyl diphosphate reductase